MAVAQKIEAEENKLIEGSKENSMTSRGYLEDPGAVPERSQLHRIPDGHDAVENTVHHNHALVGLAQRLGGRGVAVKLVDRLPLLVEPLAVPPVVAERLPADVGTKGKNQEMKVCRLSKELIAASVELGHGVDVPGPPALPESRIMRPCVV